MSLRDYETPTGKPVPPTKNHYSDILKEQDIFANEFSFNRRNTVNEKFFCIWEMNVYTFGDYKKATAVVSTGGYYLKSALIAPQLFSSVPVTQGSLMCRLLRILGGIWA